jgi:hypothetical protein
MVGVRSGAGMGMEDEEMEGSGGSRYSRVVGEVCSSSSLSLSVASSESV